MPPRCVVLRPLHNLAIEYSAQLRLSFVYRNRCLFKEVVVTNVRKDLSRQSFFLFSTATTGFSHRESDNQKLLTCRNVFVSLKKNWTLRLLPKTCWLFARLVGRYSLPKLILTDWVSPFPSHHHHEKSNAQPDSSILLYCLLAANSKQQRRAETGHRCRISFSSGET